MKKISQQVFMSVIILLTLFSNAIHAQNVTVTGAVTGNGSYPDLNSAFAAINSGLQTGANISVSILASTTETTTAVLNANTWATLSVTPSGGTAKTITGNLAGPLIDFFGADRVYIDGLENSGNSLTLSNTNSGTLSATTLRFIDGATQNTITKCTLLGSSSSTTLGTISFSTTTSFANSNNTIASCTISAAGAGSPVNGILSAGTSNALNSGNSILNCTISDFFNPALATAGINIGAGNTGWTISGNRVFQSAARTYTTANIHRAILVGSGSAHVISNNTIGYASSGSTGLYTMAGTVSVRFAGIELSAGAGAISSVQGNTITAVNLNTGGTTGTANGVLCAIGVMSGNVNVLNNLIGSTTGINQVTSNQTTTGGMVVGINSSSTGSIVIRGNTIGGLTASGLTAALAGDVVGINIAGISPYVSITDNTIGNSSADNMRAGTSGTTTAVINVAGISIVPALTGPCIISGNTIQNFSAYSSATTSFLRGIWTTGVALSAAVSYSVTDNTITKLTGNAALTTASDGKGALVGINIASGTNNVISGNTITALALTNTATTAGYAIGISVGNGTDPKISRNTINTITNARTSVGLTSPGAVVGVMIRSATNSASVYNNMISLGNGSAANTAFIGINANHAETPDPSIVNIYYNTINIEGTAATGAQPSFGFLRGDMSTTSRNIPIDFKNNLVTNTRSGGTGAHYAIANNFSVVAGSSAVGWAANAANYNVLNANTATIGWWSGSQTFAGWKTASSGDLFSYSGIAVTYANSATDLHLNMGVTPTPIESGALLNSVVTDFDGQARPGPLASVNGAGMVPDIGADEMDAVLLDGFAPVINYTNLLGSCTTGDRTFTATITDASGSPVTGVLVPAVYFRKNTGAYFSAPGSLVSGTGVSGVWSFTISAAAMGGLTFNDMVSYFVIAQDNVSNVIASPGAGLVATSVNAVVTPPSTPNWYFVSGLSGSYNIGSAGTFTSLTAAAYAYNNACLTGPVTYMLTDALYSGSETFPVTFLNNPTASSTNSLLIRPATGVSPSITGSSSLTIVGFNGADFIKVDGSNSGGTTRDLTLENSSTGTLSSVVFIGNSSATDAASNIQISNCTITGNAGTTTYGGLVLSSGVVPGAASEISNNAITLTRNAFTKSGYGIFAIGNAASPDLNWNFSSNSFGSATPSNKIGYRAIHVQNAQVLTISSNTIAGVTGTVVTNPPAGIVFSVAVSNATVSYNLISDVKNTNTVTGTSGASGLLLASTSTAANILVSNNMISDIAGYGGTGVAFGSNGNGITIASGNGYRIYHNTVLLNTNQTSTLTTARQSPLFITSGITAGAIDLRNNIFVTTQTVGTRYSIQSLTTGNTIFSNIDHNIYSTTGGTLGFISAVRNTLADIQTGFGGNLNSINASPVFVSATDLHLSPGSNAAIDDLGTPLGITNDIDLTARSLTAPDIGADEFTGSGCSSVNPAVLSSTPYTLCSGSSLTLNSTGGSSGSGIIQRWKVSSTPGSGYTDVSTGTGFSSANLSTEALATGTLYFVLTKSCTTTPLNATSNEATVIINPSPALTVSSTHTLACPSTSVILTGSGANTYTWSTTANTPTVQVIPTANTTYTLTGSIGTCTSAVLFSVTYSANPTALTVTSSSPFVCAGTQATLTATSAAATTFTWTDGVNSFTGASINPTPTVSTTYSVVGSNSVGCVSPAATQVVNVSAPNLAVTGNTAVCPGNTASLTASGAISYTWSTSENTASITTTPPSSTVLTLSGTNLLGCSASITQSVEVGNVAITIAGPSSICIGSTLSLTALGGITYTWNEGSTTTTLVPTPTITTTYSVIGAAGSCSNSAIKTVSVNPNPTVTLGGNSTLCAGETITLTPGGGASYLWNTGATTTILAVAPASSTLYSVNGINAFGCAKTATLAVTVNTVPIVSVAASASSLCLTSPVTYTASGASSYTWNGTGPNTATFNVIPTANTTYTVVGSNASNCTASKTVAIITNTLPLLIVTPTLATVCISTPTSFLAYGADTYTWDGLAGINLKTYTPTANAIHTVAGTSPEGCTVTTTISIVANPVPTVSAIPTLTTACAQSAVGYTASGALSYVWNGVTTGSAVTLSQILSTTHTVVGTNAFGCSSAATVSVTSLPLPLISVSPNFTTTCYGTPANYTASGASTYTWFNSNTGSVVAISPTVAASYSVAGTGANGCSSSSSVLILLTAPPVLTITPASATVCALSPLTLNASGAGTYTWSNGLGTNSAATATPAASSIYTVEGTDAQTGCVGSKTIAVTTNSLPVVTILPAGTSICMNASASFSASGATTYSWSTSTTGPLITVAPTGSSVYTVTGKNAANCISSKTVALTVNALPVITVAPALTSTICIGEIITYTVSGASTYTWNPGNSGATTYTAAPVTTAYYSVSGTDANGCENLVQLAVLVNGCTGITEKALLNTFNIYPNPSAGTFNIDLDVNANVMVYDLLGAIVYSAKLEAGKQILSLNDKAKGVYLLKLSVGESSKTIRLVIE